MIEQELIKLGVRGVSVVAASGDTGALGLNYACQGDPNSTGYFLNLFISLMNEQIWVAGGTSASAPLFAGLLSLFNDFLLQNNKPPLGFVNPLLYTMSGKLHN